MKDHRILAATILALGIAGAGFFVNRGIIYIKRFERSVEVKGLAERMVKSTDATWLLSYTLGGDTVSIINASAATAQQEIRKFLMEKGFKENELQKNPLQLTDKQTDPYGKKLGLRYSAQGSFIITSKKIDMLTHVTEQTDELLQSGVIITGSTINYYFTELNAIKPEMVKESVLNALEAAKSFSLHSNSTLGTIKSATQGKFSIEAPSSEYDSGTSIMKKIRVVSQVSYFIE